MATLTAANATVMQPLGHHVGVQAFTVTHSCVAYSAGDIILMGRVAVGSRILAIQRNFANTGAGDVVLSCGYTGSLSAFGSATSVAGTAFLTKNMPKDITKSDDAVPRYVDICLQVQAVSTAAAAGTVTLTVFLTNDIVGQNFNQGAY